MGHPAWYKCSYFLLPRIPSWNRGLNISSQQIPSVKPNQFTFFRFFFLSCLLGIFAELNEIGFVECLEVVQTHEIKIKDSNGVKWMENLSQFVSNAFKNLHLVFTVCLWGFLLSSMTQAMIFNECLEGVLDTWNQNHRFHGCKEWKISLNLNQMLSKTNTLCSQLLY